MRSEQLFSYATFKQKFELQVHVHGTWFVVKFLIIFALWGILNLFELSYVIFFHLFLEWV